MGLRGRLKKLERHTKGDKTVLVCPECGAEFIAYGDPVPEYLAYEWQQNSNSETYRETPADVVAIANHEHDPSLMINKATGKPWVGEFFAGTVRMPDDVEDLSEQAGEE